LTLFKTETYAQRMPDRRVLVALLSLVACALAWPGPLTAQAIRRALSVSVPTRQRPVPEPQPAVRRPRTMRRKSQSSLQGPMQVALIVDNSQAARTRSASPGASGVHRGAHGICRRRVKNPGRDRRDWARPTIFARHHQPGEPAERRRSAHDCWRRRATLLDGIIEVCRASKQVTAR
jgi:hypothetical protein